MSSQQIQIKLGKLIEKKAKQKFKTKLEFASAADVDEKSIRRIFKGEQNISLNLFKSIAIVLDTTMSDLLAEIGE
ncbi:MAG: helix-turn-helix domain-containing protein [Bacteroidota bacterium]